mmetsp:Transcript_107121/g.190327  ORF Transcript_107121/g.190327 Transcript_107121/m.190327 type:complete len:113 (-) Transcript_107121:38-376(-)|eukprot:CAMPEP_0197665230 /NCGR_PEP_ID=MMETSP1338-20131121/59107_1 /TAXON_ID=43686 ORGANISM="Pelagodinium beii, Strain RCC1491" /NCGR_SAMPLE_ID=MMETSP1338 /ASSEMBLY_ACC=CAM_ASM_000754 /LENGTH=112 /DNA_ID=CAMNT_0043244003 /DNA_START=56 /DNA_END=394 /DNA_ORIENTATION=+
MRGKKHTGRKHKNQNKKTRPTVIANKRRSKDIDQVHDDLKAPQKFKAGSLPTDEDLPGMGQYYCIACTRFFTSAEVKAKHEKSKLHKRRLQKASDTPHTQRDAEIAAGMTHE